MERVKENFKIESIAYISVSEITKAGRYHFHLLVYNLPTETAERERETRNLQRLFQRGYVDAVFATYKSEGIAGYMAKYMGKSLADAKNEATRGFTCSRNIKKITSAGGNSLSGYYDLIVPTDDLRNTQTAEYNVPYLGKCLYKKIIKN